MREQCRTGILGLSSKRYKEGVFVRLYTDRPGMLVLTSNERLSQAHPARLKGKAVSEGDAGAVSPVTTTLAGFVINAQRTNSASSAVSIDRYLRLKLLVALMSVCIRLLHLWRGSFKLGS
jgi:hypothetical protein